MMVSPRTNPQGACCVTQDSPPECDGNIVELIPEKIVPDYLGTGDVFIFSQHRTSELAAIRTRENGLLHCLAKDLGFFRKVDG
jgi:hypothetical protein